MTRLAPRERLAFDYSMRHSRRGPERAARAAAFCAERDVSEQVERLDVRAAVELRRHEHALALAAAAVAKAEEALRKAEAAERLALFFVRSLEALDAEASENCSLCLDPMSLTPNDRVLAILPCGHCFHEECWKEVRPPPRCPTCRASPDGVPLLLTRVDAAAHAATDRDEVRRRFGPKLTALAALLPQLLGENGKAVVFCGYPGVAARLMASVRAAPALFPFSVAALSAKSRAEELRVFVETPGRGALVMSLADDAQGFDGLQALQHAVFFDVPVETSRERPLVALMRQATARLLRPGQRGVEVTAAFAAIFGAAMPVVDATAAAP